MFCRLIYTSYTIVVKKKRIVNCILLSRYLRIIIEEVEIHYKDGLGNQGWALLYLIIAVTYIY